MLQGTQLLLSTGLHLLFYVALLFFVIFTCFTAYHWFTYGINKQTSTLALAIYLLVSAPLFISMAAALTLL